MSLNLKLYYLTEEEDKSDIDNDDNGPTIASMPTNVVSGNALTTRKNQRK